MLAKDTGIDGVDLKCGWFLSARDAAETGRRQTPARRPANNGLVREKDSWIRTAAKSPRLWRNTVVLATSVRAQPDSLRTAWKLRKACSCTSGSPTPERVAGDGAESAISFRCLRLDLVHLGIAFGDAWSPSASSCRVRR